MTAAATTEFIASGSGAFPGAHERRVNAEDAQSAPKAWLLLRGLGRERRHWFHFAERMNRALGVPCEPLDLPGVGQARFETAPLTVEETAAALSARIPWQAGPVGLLGISFGGMVALELCHREPGKFSHAVVVNASSRLSPPWVRLRPLGAWLVLRSLLTLDPVERERGIYELTLAERKRSAAEFASVTAGFSLRPLGARRAVVDQLIAAATFVPREVWQPVLVLSARRDRLVSRSCSVDLATHLGAVHLEHPTAGHDLPLDAPDWVTEQIRGWLASPEAVPI